MIKRLKQIWRDHQAMNMMRGRDVLEVMLIGRFYTLGGRGFTCWVNGEKAGPCDSSTPEDAIIDEFNARRAAATSGG